MAERGAPRRAAAFSAAVLVASWLTGCGSDQAPVADGPAVNITTPTGLELADLRVGTLRSGPYPVGGDAPVLARVVGTEEGDRLVGATSPAADRVVLVGADGSFVDVIDVPAVPPGEPLDLTADGPHVLLRGLAEPLRAGDRVVVTLTFERAGTVRADIPRRVDAGPPTP